MADAQEGLWWMIEHPRMNGAYWTGAGWDDIDGPVMRFTTRGEAEWEIKARAILGVLAAKVTQHGPAEECIPEGHHIEEDIDGTEIYAKNREIRALGGMDYKKYLAQEEITASRAALAISGGGMPDKWVMEYLLVLVEKRLKAIKAERLADHAACNNCGGTGEDGEITPDFQARHACKDCDGTGRIYSANCDSTTRKT